MSDDSSTSNRATTSEVVLCWLHIVVGLPFAVVLGYYAFVINSVVMWGIVSIPAALAYFGIRGIVSHFGRAA